MKKHLIPFLLLAMLVSTSSSFALLRLGLKGGVDLATVTAEVPNQVYSVDYGRKTGLVFGPTAELAISPLGDWAVRGELLYVQKGTKHTISGNEFTVKLDECVFAPFLVYRFPLPKVKPFLEAGPEFGFNVVDEYTGNSQTRDSGGNWKKTNTSLNLGAGVLLPLGPADLSLGVRYNLGLTDMGSYVSGPVNGVKTKTNGILLLVGYNFLKL